LPLPCIISSSPIVLLNIPPKFLTTVKQGICKDIKSKIKTLDDVFDDEKKTFKNTNKQSKKKPTPESKFGRPTPASLTHLRIKGTLSVISSLSSDFPFKEAHPRCTQCYPLNL